MSLSDEEMTHLKALARLDLSEAETRSLERDLNAILGYVEELSALDTDGVEEMLRPTYAENVFRDDEVRPSLPPGEALAQGVATDDGFFRVPRTVDGD